MPKGLCSIIFDSVQFNFGMKMSYSPTFLLKHRCVCLYCRTVILLQVKWGRIHIEQIRCGHSHFRQRWC